MRERGTARLMPVTFTVSLIGTFSMAGLPPFNGFLSKEMFFTSMLRIAHADIFSLDTWGVLFPVLAWIGSETVNVTGISAIRPPSLRMSRVPVSWSIMPTAINKLPLKILRRLSPRLCFT
jgi:formate hydrogenlyase subunit 3/multisubunit Na+/H+ antiporter MnhD subunit